MASDRRMSAAMDVATQRQRNGAGWTHVFAGSAPHAWRPRLADTLLTALMLGALAIGLGACGDGEGEGAFAASGEAGQPLPSATAARLSAGELEGRTELRFGATPYLGDEGTREVFAAIAVALSESLGVPVRFVVARDYQHLIDLAVRGDLEIMQLSPLSYVKAQEQLPNLRLVASSTSFGTDSYSSFLVVRTDSELHHLRDLRPRADGRGAKARLALVDPNSASGFLLPYLALREHGVDPERDLDVQFLGSHEATLQAVLDGKADVAAVSSGTLHSARTGESLGPGNLRLLYKAGRLPYDAVCVSAKLSESAAQRIAAALGTLDTRTARGREVLRKSRGMTGWTATDPARYERLRASWRQLRTLRWSRWAMDLPASASPATAPAPATPNQREQP